MEFFFFFAPPTRILTVNKLITSFEGEVYWLDM